MDKISENMPDVLFDDIVKALGLLGYPESGRIDAAKRMSWVPALASDMIEYAKMGAPKSDPQTGLPPPVLSRPLNDGYTVASLMTDFLQEPAGAFLLGAALITHRDEALDMLEKMIVDGIYIRQEDGVYLSMSVPAAENYPQCQVCGTRLFREAAYCKVCGSATAPG